MIIGGVIALALILIGVVAAVLIRDEPAVTTVPSPNTSTTGSVPPGSSAPPTSAPPAEKASDAVTGYLNALAAGDVAGALSYAADPVAAGPFLTGAVLAESAKRAPLTTVNVTPVDDDNATVVAATYKFGDTDVVENFDVVKLGDVWKLTRVVKTVELGLSRQSSVPMRINGVKVSSNTVDLLPGSYAFTTGLPYISYGSDNVVLIKSPSGDADVYSHQCPAEHERQEGDQGGGEVELQEVPEVQRRAAQGLPVPLDQLGSQVPGQQREMATDRRRPVRQGEVRLRQRRGLGERAAPGQAVRQLHLQRELGYLFRDHHRDGRCRREGDREVGQGSLALSPLNG